MDLIQSKSLGSGCIKNGQNLVIVKKRCTG